MADGKNGQDDQPIVIDLLRQVLSKVTALEVGQDALTASQASLDSRMASLEAGQASLEARMASLETGHASLEARMVSLEAGLDGLREDHLQLRVNVMDRIDRLQNTVEALRDDLRTSWNASTTAVGTVRNIRSEYSDLFDLVLSMQRQQHGLIDQVEELRRRIEPKL